MKKQSRIQFVLLFTGIILILATYLYYPNLIKEETLETENVMEDLQLKEQMNEGQSSSFENVKYKGFYDLDKPFTVQAEKAYISKEDVDLVHMKNMHVILYLSDGRVVNITSEKGRYNKTTFDCFFESNVTATDAETMIFAENLDLLATRNSVEIYNNVKLDYPTGSLKADKIDYNFETKYFKVSMFDDQRIKMQVIK